MVHITALGAFRPAPPGCPRATRQCGIPGSARDDPNLRGRGGRSVTQPPRRDVAQLDERKAKQRKKKAQEPDPRRRRAVAP